MPGRALLPVLLLAAAARGGELFRDHVAVLEPFPREVARGKTLEIRGIVKGAFKDPELILIAPNGRTYLNRDNQIGQYGFTFTVEFDEGIGPYRMEVIAKKPNSIQSAARFTVWYGRRKPAEEAEEPPPTGARDPVEIHPRLLERRFVRRLDAFRKELRLDRVGWNEAVGARAREHAERMAKAERRQHRFGSAGVVDDLRAEGAGAGGLSGPATPWDNVDSLRPFPRPIVQAPGPRVTNHVVVFVLASDSLEEMFETYFVREAAFRICAADPHCTEVAVGAARTPPPQTSGAAEVPPAPMVYYCVCFVQVNDRTIVRGQDRAYGDLLELAALRDPLHLRHVAIWGRGGAARQLLARTLKDERPEISSAALDGLFLLDEERARKEVERLAARRDELAGRGRYAEALREYEPLRFVRYDGTVSAAYAQARWEYDRRAREELLDVLKLEEPHRRKALEELKERAAGLPVLADVERALQ